jgi:serine/threonine protein kinase/tetratricopeptide (TPR) repeat protein
MNKGAAMSETRLIGGRYQILHAVGEGGMGTVYLGIDTQTQTQIAIKSLKAEAMRDDPEVVQRFAREAETLRKLNHPNIVKVLATAQEDNAHYIIMEFVEGGSLADWITEHGKMPVDRILNIALDLSDALTRAHRLKIVHRDIKPANVLIAEDGTPRLSDFGVARIEETSRMTRTGMVVGTLAYLPPEALDGQPVDERGDLWAFGIMLYEMIAARRPFEDDNMGAMLTSILTKAPPDIFQFRDDVPWTLMGLVYWLLEKDPAKRPASARLIGAMLENILSGAELPLNWFDPSKSYTPGDTPPAPTSQTALITAIREFSSTAFSVDALQDEIKTVTPPRSLTPVAPAPEDTAPPPRIPTGAYSPQVTPHTPSAGFTPSTPPPAYPPVAATATTGTPSAAPAKPISNRAFVVGLGGLLVVVVVLLIGMTLLNTQQNPPPTLVAAEPTIVVEPPASGEFMVLVADFERVGGESRDVRRFIAENLRSVFEEDNPFTRIVIRVYPAVISHDAEAQAVAEQYGADVIIWGNYDATSVTAEVQVGSLAQYQALVADRVTIVKTMNARDEMTSERRESLAYSVVAIINGLATYNGDVFTVARNLLAVQNMTTPAAEITGNSVASRYHRYLVNYITDPEESIRQVDAAIQQEANNPFLYLARALAYMRLNNIEKSRTDLATAEGLGAKDWTTILAMRSYDPIFYQHNYEAALPYLNQMVEQSPDDWFARTLRGIAAYLTGDYDTARADFNIALEQNPQGSFPYQFATAMALRDGDLATSQVLFRSVVAKFPDPSFLERLLRVTLSDEAAKSGLVPLATAYGNLALRRWQEVINSTDSSVAAKLDYTEIYFMRGVAYCNMRDYPAAIEAYTQAIELDPAYTMLYLMRADSYRRQGNILGMTGDVAVVAQSPQAAMYTPYLQSGLSGGLSCDNFFDLDLREAEGSGAGD